MEMNRIKNCCELCRIKTKASSSPVAAVHVEQNDDEAQAVTGQLGATKEPGKSLCTILPSRHLTESRGGYF